MALVNPLRSFAEKTLKLPNSIAMRILTWVFAYKVKLAGTTKLRIIDTDIKSVTFIVKNRRRVRNHIGQVHAATMALLAESATGFVVGLNLPGDKLPLIKKMNLHYVARSVGSIKAVAFLTEDQINTMNTLEEGSLIVSVKITDAENKEPMIAEMHWAWVKKHKN